MTSNVQCTFCVVVDDDDDDVGDDGDDDNDDDDDGWWWWWWYEADVFCSLCREYTHQTGPIMK